MLAEWNSGRSLKGSRVLVRSIFVGALALTLASPVNAQNAGTERTLSRAKDLSRRGDVVGARLVVDSLNAPALTESPEFAEVLFVRASLAPSILDASLDYGRIVAEFRSSARREESLLRLAQGALIGGDVTKALEYLGTMSQDYPQDSSRARASYWRARALLETRDVIGACAAIREASVHAAAAPVTLQNQIAEQANNCPRGTLVTTGTGDFPARTTGPATAVTDPSKAKTIRAPQTRARRRYTVQVAAFATRAGANGMASKLQKSGLEARVDGDKRPFRVRIGLYSTYADAATELRDLKKRKLSGFVTETDR